MKRHISYAGVLIPLCVVALAGTASTQASYGGGAVAVKQIKQLGPVRAARGGGGPPPPSPGEAFGEVEPLLGMSDGSQVFLPTQNVLTDGGGATLCYAPVADIIGAGGTPHALHVLTIFHPHPPSPSERFPAILYSPASVFRAGASGAFPVIAFLTEALKRGWAVITIGSTGIDSCPTASQQARCFSPSTACPASAAPCWDSALWYAPDHVVGSPWNDFNYFFGEKDMVWARQFVSENAVALNVDDNRVVATGTSTGAHYASFLAYGSVPWADADVPFALSSQSKRATDVQGLVAFEPVVWVQALLVPGFHWPASDDPASADYHARAGTITTVAGGAAAALDYLKANSTSTWIRGSGRSIPTFVAGGDGTTLSTGFARDANTMAASADYDRDPSSVPPYDPLLAFPSPSLLLHDYWQGIMFFEDLMLADATFHDARSELHLLEDPLVDWSYLPPAFSTTASPPADASEVTIMGHALDGTYTLDCGAAALCSSIANFELAPVAVDWLEAKVGDRATTSKRNAPPNPDSYGVTAPILGTTMMASVDLSLTGHAMAQVLGYARPLALPLAGGTLLVDITSPQLILTPLAPPVGGIATIPIPIPPTPALLGLEVYTQALHAFGVVPYALSNAQDLVYGSF